MHKRIGIVGLLLCTILVACSDDNNGKAGAVDDVSVRDAGHDSGTRDALDTSADARSDNGDTSDADATSDASGDTQLEDIDAADAAGSDAGDIAAVDADADDAGTLDAEDASDAEDIDAISDVNGAADTDADADVDVDADIDADADMDADAGPSSDDWFDPQSCIGNEWSAADALARLGGSSHETLDAQTVMERSRTCDASGCGPWSSPVSNTLRYLTWSGGVTTRYTTLQTDTTLVLYKDGGAPKLAIRHDTHLGRYPNDHSQGIAFGFPAAMVPYPRMRAWKLPPSQHSYDYTDLEVYLGRDAQLYATAHCARFEAVSPARDPESEQVEQYVAVYRY